MLGRDAFLTPRPKQKLGRGVSLTPKCHIWASFWELLGRLGRLWEIICRFTLIAQAWAGRSFHHYSGHEARYTKFLFV